MKASLKGGYCEAEFRVKFEFEVVILIFNAM